MLWSHDNSRPRKDERKMKVRIAFLTLAMAAFPAAGWCDLLGGPAGPDPFTVEWYETVDGTSGGVPAEHGIINFPDFAGSGYLGVFDPDGTTLSDVWYINPAASNTLEWWS